MHLGGRAADHGHGPPLLVERRGDVRVARGELIQLGLAAGGQRAVGGSREVRHKALVEGLRKGHARTILAEGRRPTERPYSCTPRIRGHRIALMSEPTKFLLPEDAIPTHWVNLVPDLPGDPLPPLSPRTGQPAGPDDLTPIFPMGLIGQEVSMDPEIPIPDPVRDAYRLWRPTPLYRARRLEAALDTPAKIFYKYEGTSPAGSHKPNTAVPQAYENAQAGIKKLSTETGAGQWGSALAFACTLFGLECEVFMVGSSYDQKPYRRSMMETWGATVHRSPSEYTQSGKANAEHPTGSLGIAISEAVEVAAQDEGTNYALGSVLNHVLLHQTVIGQESILQMELAGEEPDVIVACVGGGSNFGGLAYPWLRRGGKARFVAAEPAA